MQLVLSQHYALGCQALFCEFSYVAHLEGCLATQRGDIKQHLNLVPLIHGPGGKWLNRLSNKEVLVESKTWVMVGTADEGVWTVGSVHQSPLSGLVGVLRAEPLGHSPRTLTLGGGAVERRVSDGCPAERRASSGCLAERQVSGGCPTECRASGGGLAERRASGGGPAERWASGGGPTERRASGGGSAERRALGGGPAELRALTHGESLM
ncbi:hypothetical protein M5K25_026855 [Dendrobium thyrsiflorum]|uniref:Uncharacterized protein n=1 Tax=Dendrobium thyrsiflorum TaxID=117978 RepID=A0ABD0TYA4_DENTH